MPIFNRFVLDPDKNPDPFELTALGVLLPIEIHVPTQIAQVLTAAGQHMPECVKGMALLDTGASKTCVHEEYLVSLGLNPVGVQNCGTANGQVSRSVYPTRLVLPTMGWSLNNTQTIGVDLTGQESDTTPPEPIIALLGRNLLQQWVFTYNGPGGCWTLGS